MNTKNKYTEELVIEKKIPHFYDFYDIHDFKNVYEPSDDTFLLTDVLGLEREEIIKKLNFKSIEIGCGSGYLSAYFLSKYSDYISKHICIDINKEAIKVTKKILNDFLNYKNVEVIESNLFGSLNDKFDIIIFNPVYS